MADTPSLLQQLPGFEGKQGVHYPVLVPNMRGLDNLIKLDEQHRRQGRSRVTDEIAVFISATDVSDNPLHYSAFRRSWDGVHYAFRTAIQTNDCISRCSLPTWTSFPLTPRHSQKPITAPQSLPSSPHFQPWSTKRVSTDTGHAGTSRAL